MERTQQYHGKTVGAALSSAAHISSQTRKTQQRICKTFFLDRLCEFVRYLLCLLLADYVTFGKAVSTSGHLQMRPTGAAFIS